MKLRFLATCAAIALAAAGAAQAQQPATTSKSVHLRAGPGRDYPVVAVLAPQTAVSVYGCTTNYAWCDVDSGFGRGWVYAGNLLYPYQNGVAVLPSVAALAGIGIIGFALDDYWGDHYRDRSWYPQRRRWFRPAPLPPVRARPPQMQPPRAMPAPRPGPGPQGQPRAQRQAPRLQREAPRQAQGGGPGHLDTAPAGP